MLAPSAKRLSAGEVLCHVLLDYLQASRVIDWPGADGLTVDDILSFYPQACAAGAVPDCQELCRRHAELVTEIQALFLLKGWLGRRDPW
jgi:hypothetical protein